ncbi:MAG: CPBP family intramembrane metalloprotease [Candidatus Bathyarchaeota archaeon]|nr:CPBP family intramembrane metalloprotease [Candidatus Bathyarchaeota archaeon]
METQKTSPVPLCEAALVIIATFFIFVFISTAVQFTFGDEPTLIIGELLILAVPLTYLLLKHINITSFMKIGANPKSVATGLALGVLLILINIAVSNLLVTVFGESTAVEQSNQLLSGLSVTPTGFAAVATSLVLAGICEEFAFRGFLQNSIFKNLKNGRAPQYAFPAALIISAAIFGFFHFDPQLVYT